MKQVFKRIAPHLYKRQYQAANGEWTTLYYGILVDWKGKRRSFPLGSELRTAREQLKILEADNVKRKDFDKEKEDRRKAATAGMTIAEWLDRYLDLMKGTKSGKTIRAYSLHLKRLLGSVPLQDVTKVRIMEYKNRRLDESTVRHGEPVEGWRIKGATVNREVSCLIAALNLAHDEGLCEGPPRVKKESEEARERILSDAECKALLDASPGWLRRIIIGANEAALDRGVLINLTWDSVRDGLIKISRAKTGADQRVGISPALSEVLEELRVEYRRVPNTEHRVFTKDGKPVSGNTLRYAFEKALQDSKIEDFQFRDFRHCARTRWAADGLSYEVAEGGLGHKLPGMHGRYTNLTDSQIRDAFQKMFTGCLQEKSDFARANERSL
ncbi:MAG: tyrosine-type recombinase/integrase [Deltaproteobacteria bacterium]|nr:tyrosine-type recombinase/integrase [Deltaproteobacteria bacterium]